MRPEGPPRPGADRGSARLRARLGDPGRSAGAGGPSAGELATHGPAEVEELALRELSSALQLRRAKVEPLIESTYHHNWTTDRYSLGAYSYVGVGGTDAPKQMTRPVESTLFFAGEATDTENSGTVEGAIASGKRAARQILSSVR